MPSKNIVERALASIRKGRANYDYFFGRLDSPEWLSPLRDAGLFRTPPEAERRGDTISFPDWGEATYLARIASRAPNEVLNVLLNLPDTDNIRVHDQLVTVALALPPNLAERWSRRELAWLKTQQALYFLPPKLAQLVVHLATGGRADAALAMARQLLEPEPDLPTGRVVRDIRVKMSEWEYGDLLRRLRPVLIATLRVQGFEFFVSLLDAGCKALDPDSDGRYSGWRSAIEDHEQNIGDQPIDHLVSCVRDAAECLVLGNVLEPADLAQRLLDRGGVFARIGLHILCRFIDRVEDVTARCLGNRAYFDSVDVRHEYDALAEAACDGLPQDVVDSVLRWVEEGPGWLGRSDERRVTDHEIRRDLQFWQRDRLYPFRNALPADWKQRYADLIATVGEPDHPGFSLYRRSWVGPTSPKTVAELQTLSLDELLDFLAVWKPKDDWLQPSEEGLGRILEQVIVGDPERFVVNCERFQLADPTYVRSVISGIAAVVKAGKEIDWHPVLRLCTWVMGQPRAIAERIPPRGLERDPDWGWTRKQIADLLVDALEPRQNGIPNSERKTVWKLLEALAKDSDPEKSANDQSSMDAYTQSLNTVRGRALHAVMRYVLWVIRDGGPEQSEFRSDGLTPEVASLLDRALDPEIEPSEAVRSVFGRWFWMLAKLDPDWLSKRTGKIFPVAASEVGLRRAAWETYVSWSSPGGAALTLLGDQYLWAVSCLGRSNQTKKRPHFAAAPQERLAEHLMELHWRGEIDPETAPGLLREFFDKAEPTLREHALSFVGRSLHATPAESADAESIARMKALFERRLALAIEKPKIYGVEFRCFGWWFSASALDRDWRFKQVAAALSVAPELEGAFLVVEELEKHIHDRPLEVLDTLDRLLRCENAWWLVIGSRAEFESILTAALGQATPSVRERASAIVHQLGAQGHATFRQLLEGKQTAERQGS